MAPIKPYKPNDLNVNPFAVAQGIALPYDYNGTLNQFQEWNKLANNEAITDQNQIQASDAQDAFELKQKRDAAIQAEIEAGTDPLKLDYSKISRDVGDWDGLVNAEKIKAKAAQEQNEQYISQLSKADKLIKSNPAMKNDIVARLNAQGIQVAPQQFANKGSGDKPDKPKAPKNELYVNRDGDVMDVNVNDPAAVSAARKLEYFSLPDISKATSSNIDLFPEPEEPKDTRGFFSFLNGDESKNKAVNPGNSAPPPGYELTGKVVNGRMGIRKIR